ncbi:MAG: methyl-accepting chemotaxis protein [Bacteriovorax sp.]|nr:methyl-accepting chemotaxis protein [Bacteriovorax sp.]
MESSSRNNRKFKNYLILPQFQLKFVFTLVATNIFIAMAILSSIYFFFINSSTLFGVFQYMKSDTSINFRNELSHFLIILGCLSVLFIILISIVALIISHRTAGPIYQFKITYDKISKGNFEERLHFRPNDDFQDVALSFIQMMDQVTKKDK